MENNNRTSVQLNYSDEELWNTWHSSRVRTRYISFLVADGCSSKGARTQADFDFDSYTREPGERRITPENEIHMFEQKNEMHLWKLWSSSNARIQHITSLLTIGLSPEASADQEDLHFKSYYSAFDDQGRNPEGEIKSFERYSRNEKLKFMWQSSKTRDRYFKFLMPNALPPEGAVRQADIDFDDHAREMGRRDLTP